MGKRELVALLYLARECECSVALAHDAVDWSTLCDCGFVVILTFYSMYRVTNMKCSLAWSYE